MMPSDIGTWGFARLHFMVYSRLTVRLLRRSSNLDVEIHSSPFLSSPCVGNSRAHASTHKVFWNGPPFRWFSRVGFQFLQFVYPRIPISFYARLHYSLFCCNTVIYINEKQPIRKDSCPSMACPAVLGATEWCSSHSSPISSLSAVTPLSCIVEVNSMASQSLRQLAAHLSTLSSTYLADTKSKGFEQ